MTKRQRQRFAAGRRQAGQLQFYDVGPTEDDVYEAIVQALEAANWFVSRFAQKRPSGQTSGIPDLFVAHPIHQCYAWLEVKKPGGRTSRDQREWHDAVRASGCPVFVVDSPGAALRQLHPLHKPPSPARRMIYER